MARKKVTPEEEIVNTAVEGTALGSVPADTAPPDETGADSGDFPAELPEGDLPAEETAEQSETLPAMEAAEAKPLGLSTEEKTASQDESDTAEERVKEAELHEEMSEFPDAEENLISDLPTSVPQVSEADEADWGFGEPVPEEAAAEAAEDEYLAAGNSEMLDASDEKSERTLFYELDFNELDRGLSEEERKEWNSIYASFRGRSAITGTIIGVDLYARYLPRSEARMLENKRELCAVVVPYRIPILIRESEMWELGEERPDFVLRNMVGASIDVIVTKVERTASGEEDQHADSGAHHPKRMHGSILQVGYVGINSQNQLGEQREKQCQRKYENVGYAYMLPDSACHAIGVACTDEVADQ